MNSTTNTSQVPEGFSLVYQGGHHDVYCNGIRHQWFGGGYAGIAQKRFQREGKCDCAYWKGFNEMLMRPTSNREHG
jgi:hypothetical protein